VQMLLDRSQHPMVRHEAAEALGAIGSSSVLGLLTEMLHDDEEIVLALFHRHLAWLCRLRAPSTCRMQVRESCIVALAMHDKDAFLAAGIVV